MLTAARTRQSMKIILRMIKIEHTVFALPFAFMGAFLAADGLPPLRVCAWVLVAMVGARSASMAFNRLVDARIDARNPRTAGRALPQGLLKKSEVALFTAASAAVFVLAAWMLNTTSFALSWPVLVILLSYSFTKRFTWLSHFILGFCLGMTPLAGWISVKGSFDLLPVLLSAGVLFWTAGFDLIYACQDTDVDRKAGLYSIPARFGIKKALILSGVLHIFTVAFFCAAGIRGGLLWPYWGAVAVAAVFLAAEHALVRPSDLSRVNLAFFTINGFVSIFIAAGACVSVVM